MIVIYNSTFVTQLTRRIVPDAKLFQKYQRQVELFSSNPHSKHLGDHPLTGKFTGFRSFSVTKDIRVVYFLKNKNHAVFTKIGTHQEVYS